MLTIDNGERTAPAAFNDSDLLEISRKIEREEGSTYRVNGKEVRARDVQILFAVRAGARSWLWSARARSARSFPPSPRPPPHPGRCRRHRRLRRRHEAELRLKAAEDNLVRVEDVIRELSRSRPEATGPPGLLLQVSAEIAALEALMYAISFSEARGANATAERQVADNLKAVADARRSNSDGNRPGR